MKLQSMNIRSFLSQLIKEFINFIVSSLCCHDDWNFGVTYNFKQAFEETHFVIFHNIDWFKEQDGLDWWCFTTFREHHSTRIVRFVFTNIQSTGLCWFVNKFVDVLLSAEMSVHIDSQFLELFLSTSCRDEEWFSCSCWSFNEEDWCLLLSLKIFFFQLKLWTWVLWSKWHWSLWVIISQEFAYHLRSYRIEELIKWVWWVYFSDELISCCAKTQHLIWLQSKHSILAPHLGDALDEPVHHPFIGVLTAWQLVSNSIIVYPFLEHTESQTYFSCSLFQRLDHLFQRLWFLLDLLGVGSWWYDLSLKARGHDA